MLPLTLLVLALSAPPAELVGPPEPRRDALGERLPAGAVARYGDARLRGGLTEAVGFSPDGKQLLRTRSGAVEITDLATGKDVTPAYLLPLRNVRVYPLHDGRHLVHDTRTNTIHLYDPKSGEKIADLDLDQQKAYSVNLTPDGKGAMVWWQCSTGCGATAFDFAAAKPVARHFRLPVWSAYALSPDRKRVYAASANSLEVYEFDSGKKLDTKNPGTGQHARPLVSADGGTVVLVESGRLFVCQVTKDGLGEVSALPGTGGGNVDPNYAVTSPDGKRLLVNTTGTAVDLKTGEVAQPKAEHKRTNRSGCFYSPDGRLACDLFGPLGLVVRDTTTGKTVREILGLAELRSAVVTDDRTVTTLDAEMVSRVYDLSSGKLLEERTKRSEPAKGQRWGIAADDSGVILESDLNSPKVRVSNTKTGEEGPELDHKLNGFVSYAQLRNDLDRAVLTVQGKAALLELSSGKLLRYLPTNCYAASLSPSGRLLAAAADTQVNVIETATNKVRRTFTLGQPNQARYQEELAFRGGRAPQPAVNGNQVGTLRFTPDGDTLALFAGDGRVWVWDVSDGTLLYQDANAVGRRTGAISPDGRWLAVAGADGSLALRDLSEPKIGAGTVPVRESRSPVKYVAFTTDSTRFVTAHTDGLAHLWDVGELAALGKGRPALDPDDALWAALADPDAGKGGKAVDDLSRDPAAAVRVLAARLRPVAPPDPKRVARLVEELFDREYKVREAAEKELTELRELATIELEAAAKSSESAEQLERVNNLIGRLAAAEANPERVRQLRAVEVLERVGTPEARTLLDRMAGGAAGSAVTREAALAVKRLGQRPMR